MLLNLIGDEFRPVFAADKTGRSVLVDELFENLNDILCPVALARTKAVALLRILVNDAQDAKARTPISLVVNNVPTLNLIASTL